MVVITIDTRETELIDFFQKRTEQLNGKGILWKIAMLEVGDVWIQNDSNSVQLAFERKTFNDLASSIKDGRYREQKARLLSQFPANRITYILEECSTYFIWTTEKTQIYHLATSAYGSFILHTMYRDGIHVYISKNTEETALFLIELALRIEKNPTMMEGNQGSSSSYIDVCSIKTRKMENNTPFICFQMQLGQVPGISSKIVSILCQHTQCQSMKDWIQKLNSFSENTERVTYLSTIPGIGKKKAELLLTYFGYA
jgi:ERCC4-type nuclease